MAADPLTLLAETAFLGEEFGTWLWYRCEAEDGEFDLGHLGRVALALGDDLVLTGSDEGGAGVAALKRGSPAFSAEARAALSVGKKVSKMRLVIARGEEQWTGTLDAVQLSFSRLSLPPIPAETPADAFIDRMYALQDVLEIIDALLRDFLAIRLSPLWDDEVGRVRQWIAHRLPQAKAG